MEKKTSPTVGSTLDCAAIVRNTVECYTTRSLSTLVKNFQQMDPSYKFIDPFVIAAPKKEALIQFASLQSIFTSVSASVDETSIVTEQGANGTHIHFNCTYVFTLSRGACTRCCLPEKVTVEAETELVVDSATGKVGSCVPPETDVKAIRWWFTLLLLWGVTGSLQ